jgi:hypothetical protein
MRGVKKMDNAPIYQHQTDQALHKGDADKGTSQSDRGGQATDGDVARKAKAEAHKAEESPKTAAGDGARLGGNSSDQVAKAPDKPSPASSQDQRATNSDVQKAKAYLSVINLGKMGDGMLNGAINNMDARGKQIWEGLKGSLTPDRRVREAIAEGHYGEALRLHSPVERAKEVVTGIVRSVADSGVRIYESAKEAGKAFKDRIHYTENPQEPGAVENVQRADHNIGSAMVDLPLETANFVTTIDGVRGMVEGVAGVGNVAKGAVEKSTTDIKPATNAPAQHKTIAGTAGAEGAMHDLRQPDQPPKVTNNEVSLPSQGRQATDADVTVKAKADLQKADAPPKTASSDGPRTTVARGQLTPDAPKSTDVTSAKKDVPNTRPAARQSDQGPKTADKPSLSSSQGRQVTDADVARKATGDVQRGHLTKDALRKADLKDAKPANDVKPSPKDVPSARPAARQSDQGPKTADKPSLSSSQGRQVTDADVARKATGDVQRGHLTKDALRKADLKDAKPANDVKPSPKDTPKENPTVRESRNAGIAAFGENPTKYPDPFTGKEDPITSSREKRVAANSADRASIAENEHYKAELLNGKVGIQQAGRVHEGGPDMIFYNEKTNRIETTDVKLRGPDGSYPQTKSTPQALAKWGGEIDRAINGWTDHSGNRVAGVDTGNPALDQKIRDAWVARRVEHVQVNVRGPELPPKTPTPPLTGEHL